MSLVKICAFSSKWFSPKSFLVGFCRHQFGEKSFRRVEFEKIENYGSSDLGCSSNWNSRRNDNNSSLLVPPRCLLLSRGRGCARRGSACRGVGVAASNGQVAPSPLPAWTPLYVTPNILGLQIFHENELALERELLLVLII